MKHALFCSLMITAFAAQSQNVGIGTTTPATNLHVFNSTGSAIIRVQTGSTDNEAALELQSSTTTFDFLQFRKYRVGASGTLAGIPLSGLSLITTGAGADGGLLLGTIKPQPFYLTTNNTVRMRINENGLAALNAAVSPTVQLNVATTLRDGIVISNNTVGAGAAFGVNAQVLTTNGAAISGGTSPASEPISAYEAGSYALLGTAGNTGIAGGFFSLGGTALRVKSSSGLSLSTTGNLRFAGIGEAANKVLTTDASGNATWKSLPASAGVWVINGTNIYNSNTGNVGIGTDMPTSKLQVEGGLFVNSSLGTIKLGYPGINANSWEFVTINGGANLRIKSESETGTTRFPYYFGQNGKLGINLDTTSNIEPQYALHVAARNKYAIYAATKQFGADTVAGVFGFASSPTPIPYSAGVRGESNSTNQNGIGVLGLQAGSGWGVAGFAKENSVFDYGAGVYGAIGQLPGTGIGGYGVLGTNYNTNGYGGAFRDFAPSGGGALLTTGKIRLTGIGEGASKVLTSDASGNATWKQLPAFVHKATGANSAGHITTLTYTSPLQSDILLVTPNFNPVGGPSAYNDHPIGVYWTGSAWTIFNQDFAAIAGTSYNVMVIKQ